MGAKLVESPNSLASQSDVIFSIVGYPSDVRHVILDPNSGALSGRHPRRHDYLQAFSSRGHIQSQLIPQLLLDQLSYTGKNKHLH
ncbi:unnamed protein product [Eruca vesicaria subsp. sativa]|uniref:Uncharacterized protein n=1 Tax=Eruca vesicaria subsp. sativa TaxID=29727 RepID=A0ABC8L3R8_ERUVS|nr:unnamed protein product [Eruca vesicaria subsp. sativa]